MTYQRSDRGAHVSNRRAPYAVTIRGAAALGTTVLGTTALGATARVLVILGAVALAGCDSDPLAIFDETPPAPETAQQADARQRADNAAAADANAPTPDLRDVPERPEATSTPSTREKVVEGLIADRANARYTDEAIRLQGTGRQTAGPSASEKAATPPVTAASAVTVATAPAPPAVTPPPPPPAPVPAPVAAPPVTAPTAPPAAQVAAVPPPAPRLPVPAATSPFETPPQAPATERPRGAVTVDRSALDGFGGSPGRNARAGAVAGDQVATIQFAQSSAKLNARDRTILQQVAAIHRQIGGSLIVVGHASSRTQQLDKVEHEIANLNISMARANAVADVLVENGVARERVTVEAISDSRPVYDESMPTGEAGNRRTEIFLAQ